ncbi:hypothetical protein ACRALDRAFT_1093431 [Sodiomyces alcalophilus JCM 7366]|uniref:uncharacterized protein n=1 Tax=Sodiomyces alcalophilus JCM 7366 TaxID=591952 RepID=UPI0039B3E3CD
MGVRTDGEVGVRLERSALIPLSHLGPGPDDSINFASSIIFIPTSEASLYSNQYSMNTVGRIYTDEKASQANTALLLTRHTRPTHARQNKQNMKVVSVECHRASAIMLYLAALLRVDDKLDCMYAWGPAPSDDRTARLLPSACANGSFPLNVLTSSAHSEIPFQTGPFPYTLRPHPRPLSTADMLTWRAAPRQVRLNKPPSPPPPSFLSDMNACALLSDGPSGVPGKNDLQPRALHVQSLNTTSASSKLNTAPFRRKGKDQAVYYVGAACRNLLSPVFCFELDPTRPSVLSSLLQVKQLVTTSKYYFGCQMAPYQHGQQCSSNRMTVFMGTARICPPGGLVWQPNLTHGRFRYVCRYWRPSLSRLSETQARQAPQLLYSTPWRRPTWSEQKRLDRLTSNVAGPAGSPGGHRAEGNLMVHEVAHTISFNVAYSSQKSGGRYLSHGVRQSTALKLDAEERNKDIASSLATLNWAISVVCLQSSKFVRGMSLRGEGHVGIHGAGMRIAEPDLEGKSEWAWKLSSSLDMTDPSRLVRHLSAYERQPLRWELRGERQGIGDDFSIPRTQDSNASSISTGLSPRSTSNDDKRCNPDLDLPASESAAKPRKGMIIRKAGFVISHIAEGDTRSKNTVNVAGVECRPGSLQISEAAGERRSRKAATAQGNIVAESIVSEKISDETSCDWSLGAQQSPPHHLHNIIGSWQVGLYCSGVIGPINIVLASPASWLLLTENFYRQFLPPRPTLRNYDLIIHLVTVSSPSACHDQQNAAGNSTPAAQACSRSEIRLDTHDHDVCPTWVPAEDNGPLHSQAEPLSQVKSVNTIIQPTRKDFCSSIETTSELHSLTPKPGKMHVMHILIWAFSCTVWVPIRRPVIDACDAAQPAGIRSPLARVPQAHQLPDIPRHLF